VDAHVISLMRAGLNKGFEHIYVYVYIASTNQYGQYVVHSIVDRGVVYSISSLFMHICGWCTPSEWLVELWTPACGRWAIL